MLDEIWDSLSSRLQSNRVMGLGCTGGLGHLGAGEGATGGLARARGDRACAGGPAGSARVLALPTQWEDTGTAASTCWLYKFRAYNFTKFVAAVYSSGF